MQNAEENRPQDAVNHSFVDELPRAWRPYARLARWDRPIGWWLLLLPCWWSLALAASSAAKLPSIWYLFVFFMGAIAMRGAGSTWNDILDRDLDAQVERTKLRPLPSGDVSVKQAFLFLGLQALIGLFALLQFDGFTMLLGIVSLLPVLIYPRMKRFTSYPQMVLGLAFAWGALMGWSAFFGRLDWPAVALYIGGIAWVVGYDTIYALQDSRDDAIIGIGSTARAMGDQVIAFIMSCYALASLMITIAIVMAGVGIISYIGLLGFSAHLLWQVSKVQINDRAMSLLLFRSNKGAGLILFLGLALDAIMRSLSMR